ncbi:transmembrane protease serine 6-like isoform X2 [Xenia sp. Carnegie-2017]|uniref:transmembrane protease serine 6-like isoform X2 n=2 Tax=Xenia sp. Carnegie-2017 TaxID=2897299 RepID=UPI001F043A63|nr:transmembrane protease serine 6-like isoform X2 [Xenia sp. Carnegie-2017]
MVLQAFERMNQFHITLYWLKILVLCFSTIQVSFSRQNCGVKTIEAHGRMKRVIGGYTSKMNSWPWIVNMIDKDNLRQYCSGVIIDEKWILTVAHCFIYYGDNRTNNATSLPVTKYKYLIADHMYNVTDPYEFSVEPAQLFIHPKYKLGNDMHPGDYDVALIKLKRKIQFNKYVKKACLPNCRTLFGPTDLCYIAGWGNTVNTEKYHRSRILKEVEMKLVPHKCCKSKIGKISKRFLCAGYAKGGKDACYGDSGAPLQCFIDGRWTIAGLVSWGNECAKPNSYGVYTNVQNVLHSFIAPVLRGFVHDGFRYRKRPTNLQKH